MFKILSFYLLRSGFPVSLVASMPIPSPREIIWGSAPLNKVLSPPNRHVILEICCFFLSTHVLFCLVSHLFQPISNISWKTLISKWRVYYEMEDISFQIEVPVTKWRTLCSKPRIYVRTSCRNLFYSSHLQMSLQPTKLKSKSTDFS